MTIPSESQLRQIFLSVRKQIVREGCLNTEESIELHNLLLDTCLLVLDSTYVGKNKILEKFKNYNLPVQRLQELFQPLLEISGAFKEYPGVIASLFELKPESEILRLERPGKYGEQHGEKRREGRFFTPLYVARFMADLLVDRFYAFKPQKGSDIKVLDPSVGGGIFLDALYTELKKRDYSPEYILRSLYGVDRDPVSPQLVKRILKLKSGGFPVPQNRFIRGDFLIDDLDFPKEGFDLIIGNPPYVSYYSREAQADKTDLKSRLMNRYKHIAGGSVNTFIYFLVRSIELLNDSGMICFIIPDKLLWNRRYKKVRKFILENAPPREIIKLGEDIFEGATVGSVIILLNKDLNNEGDCVLSEARSNREACSIRIGKKKRIDPVEFLKEREVRFIFREPLLRRIEKDSVALGEITHVRDGINTAFPDFKRRVVATKKETPNHRKLIEGSDIQPFKINQRSLYINYDQSLVTPDLKKRGVSLRQPWIFDAEIKLVNRQTSNKLIFAYDENKLCNLNSVHNTILKENYRDYLQVKENTVKGLDKIILHYLLGIMNSRLMNYYYQGVTQETAKNFPQVHIADLKVLPVKIPEFELLKIIADISRDIRLGKSDKTSNLFMLDDFVFALYEVSRRDRKKIIKHTGSDWRLI